MQEATRPGDSDRSTSLDQSPFALADAIVEGFPCRVYPYAPRCLISLYRRAASAGDSPFIFHDETELRYRDLFRRSAQLATALQSLPEVQPGARIGLALENPVAWVVSFVAVTSIGATAVLLPLEPRWLERCAEAASCSLIISDSAESSGTFASYAALARNGSESEADRTVYRRELDPSHEAVVAFSSGSTGHPKGVILTHLALVTGAMNMISGAFSAGGARSGPRERTAGARVRPCCLLLSPLSNIAGLSQLLLMLMFSGTLVFCKRGSVSELAELIERRAVRSISGLSPVDVAELVAAAPQARSLAGLSFSGSVPDAWLLRWIQERWPHVSLSVSYGMTETAGAICSAPADIVIQRPFCVGRILPAVQVRIADDDGVAVPEGAPGEIQVRGAALLRGYCTQTPASRTSDGWFRTGDIGSLSEDRYLSVFGRRYDCVLVDDTQVRCSVIERALRESLRSSEVCVFKVRTGSTAQEEIVVAVAGRDAQIPAATVVQIVRAQPGCDHAPVSVFSLEALPRNAVGKIDRARLTGLWAETQTSGR